VTITHIYREDPHMITTSRNQLGLYQNTLDMTHSKNKR
jgi:hypothetical protein